MLKGPIAMFWILREKAGSLSDMLAAISPSEGTKLGPHDEPTACKWAGMSADCWLAEREPYRVLSLRIPQSTFFDMVEPDNVHLPIGRDRGLPFAQTFAETALALAAEVGVLAIRGHHQDANWIRDFEWRVQAYEIDDLLDERFGLLYVNDDYLPHWTHTPVRDDRDELPVARGRLLFAGRGGSRWF